MRDDARRFVECETQFHLGGLLTERSHPVTANLSAVAQADPCEAIRLLWAVDQDIPPVLRHPDTVDAARRLAADMTQTLKRGGRIFFTGCGSTGRLAILLDAAWRRFWREHDRGQREMERRVVSVMAGGDYALIRAVEGYEDYPVFGERQVMDAGLCASDLVCAVTEGGETSFVTGTARAGVAAGATVWFVYNNPNEALAGIQRSREIIEDDRVSKVCLATGPMAISGSTRMQATTAEMVFLGSALESVVADMLSDQRGADTARTLGADAKAPDRMADRLTNVIRALGRTENMASAARWALFERETYERGGLLTYFADRYALDVLTDTTERSPTFLVPPFVKRGEHGAPSWSYLVTPCEDSTASWRRLLQRDLSDVAWSSEEIATMVGAELPAAMPRITRDEITRFDISLSGLEGRLRDGRDAVVIAEVGDEFESDDEQTAAGRILAHARERGARTMVVRFRQTPGAPHANGTDVVSIVIPPWPSALGLGEHVAVKMVMNAVSSLTMTLMGRVLGNCMTWVSPANKKLIDRASRYVARLSDRPYGEACDAVFYAMEYVRLHVAGEQRTPPAVLLAGAALLSGVSVREAHALIEESLANGQSAEDLIHSLRKT